MAVHICQARCADTPGASLTTVDHPRCYSLAESGAVSAFGPSAWPIPGQVCQQAKVCQIGPNDYRRQATFGRNRTNLVEPKPNLTESGPKSRQDESKSTAISQMLVKRISAFPGADFTRKIIRMFGRIQHKTTAEIAVIWTRSGRM